MAKRKVMMLYGEKTVQVNYRVPESKKDEIDAKIKDLLKGYENPQRVNIDVRESDQSKIKVSDYYKPVKIVLDNPSWEPKSDIDELQDNIVFQDMSSVIDKMLEKKIEQEAVEDKIEYEILESFPFGIEKIEDFGKNKALYFHDQEYYTRVINEKAKHISYESAVNYLKLK